MINLIAIVIGNILEWYDFVMYGYFAGIIGGLFFPGTSHYASLLASFGVFAAGYLVRPIGGVFLGHIGDKYGRKKSLLTSIGIMSIATITLSVLPTYAVLGIVAPMLLIIVRLFQGFAIGGEFTGAIIYATETSSPNRRAFVGSLPSFAAFAGILLSSAVATLVTYFVPQQYIGTYGWRVPFMIGGLLALISFWWRRKLPETESFSKISSAKKIIKLPFAEVVLYQYKAILKTIALCFAYAIFTYLPFVYSVTFLTSYQGFSFQQALLSNTLGILLLTILIPVAGRLAIKYDKIKILRITLVVMLLASFPLFFLYTAKNLALVIFAQLLFAVITAPLQALTPLLLTDLFPTNTRYSGTSISYNITLGFFGGTAPLVVTFFISLTGWMLIPAVYLVIASAISIYGLAISLKQIT